MAVNAAVEIRVCKLAVGVFEIIRVAVEVLLSKAGCMKAKVSVGENVGVEVFVKVAVGGVVGEGVIVVLGVPINGIGVIVGFSMIRFMRTLISKDTNR